jgi:transcription elongation factor Elf1
MIPCPVCGDKNAQQVSTLPHETHGTAHCAKCGAVFVYLLTAGHHVPDPIDDARR